MSVIKDLEKYMESNRSTMHEILSDDYKEVELSSVQVYEEIDNNQTSIMSELKIGDEQYDINSSGKGSVDALWSGISSVIEDESEYEILEDVEFLGYRAEAEPIAEDLISTESEVEVRLDMSKASGYITFHQKSHSVLEATLLCFTQVIEYLLNSEKAFKRTQELLESAKDRNRQDLVRKYTNTLSELTKVFPHSNLDE